MLKSLGILFEANLTQSIDNDFFLYSCDAGTSGCDTVDLMLDFFNTDDCSGDTRDDYYINYVLIDQISCTDFGSSDYYFALTATQSTGVEINLYTDSDCTELYNTTVTVPDGDCDEWWNGNSTQFTFDNSGGSGSGSDSGAMSNNYLSIFHLVYGLVVIVTMIAKNDK